MWRRRTGRGRSVTVDARHRRDPSRAPVELGLLTTDAGCPAPDRHRQGDRACQRRRGRPPPRGPGPRRSGTRPRRRRRPSGRTCHAAASRIRAPTSRRRVVNQQNAIPPAAHWSSTVAASRRITATRVTRRVATATLVRRTPPWRTPERSVAVASAIDDCRPSTPRSLTGRSACAAFAVLAGCATGQRPTLVDRADRHAGPGGRSGDRPAGEGERFDLHRHLRHHAHVDERGHPGDRRGQQGSDERVTIGSVDYVTDGTTSRTCVAGGTDCVDGIDEARISNLQITQDFWGDTAATRLLNVANASLSPSTKRVDTVAGQPGHLRRCHGAVDEHRCVRRCGGHSRSRVEVGPLARYSGADVVIDAHVVLGDRRRGTARVLSDALAGSPVRRRSAGGRPCSSRPGHRARRRRCPRAACPTCPARRYRARC